MKKIIKFFKLPLRMKGLMIEAFLLLGYSRFIVLHFQFKKIANILGKSNTETVKANDEINLDKVKMIARAIRTMSKSTPWESKCLVQAYAAKLMLKKRNQPCTVYLGVSKDENGQMIAHAWVRCGEMYVTGGDGAKFTVTGKFS